MPASSRRPRLAAAATLALLLAGCPADPETGPVKGDGGADTTPGAAWTMVQEKLPGALLSVWGTSERDVWSVGADARDGSGPLVLHYDGTTWNRVATGETSGDLWWVYGFSGGPLFMGGGGGVILRYENGKFTKMKTPGTSTVFGIWGESPSAMWAVGGNFDTDGFAWRLDGAEWKAETSLPADAVKDAAIWKVFGRSANDVWLVGSGGLSFHWNGTALEKGDTGVGTSLFTVHANGARFVAVGGQASGFVVENDGAGWKKTADATYGLTGVVLGADERGYAVGAYGSVYARDASGWHEEDTRLSLQLDLHGVWMDRTGGVWAVGGRTASFPLADGLMIHKDGAFTLGGI